MSGMTSVRETPRGTCPHRHGVHRRERRPAPDHRSGGIATGGLLGLQQGRPSGVSLLRAHQAARSRSSFPMSATLPTPTSGAGSSRSWTTPRPGSTTCNTPPAIPRAMPSSGSRAITRAARRTCTRRSRASASRSTSRRNPGTCSPTSSSTRTAPSPSRHRESRPGDCIVMKAEMDATIVVSACPQDQNLTCGGRPTDIRGGNRTLSRGRLRGME